MTHTAPAKSADTLLASALKRRDALERLSRVADARDAHRRTGENVSDAIVAAITYARTAGQTWASIAEVLGVSTQRAQQLAKEATE